jgi:hypothetical protein
VKRIVLCLVVCVILVSALSCLAATAATTAEKVTSLAKMPTIAIFPCVCDGARKGTEEALPEVYQDIFSQKGFDVRMGVPVEQAMRLLDVRTEGVPTDKEMLSVGEKMGVDFVLFCEHKFHTKNVWNAFGPKARTKLELKPRIVSVQKQEVVFSDGTSNYQKGGSKYQTGVALLVSAPAALFMGGNKGKVEKKTAVASIGAAYQPFFDSLVTDKKIR